MKTVTVTIQLLLENDQPVVDWLPSLIETQLNPYPVIGEEILSYEDDEKVVTE